MSPLDRAAARARFRLDLLSWYDSHRRDLPWRRTKDPYKIWLSEIMLQQTRVAVVTERYKDFLRRFPTLQRLAAASESDVLAAWSGLGYYRRARLLHQAAKRVVAKHGGRFPKDPQSLQLLPGIGRYTAAAIASIAFREPVAVVDGNVERVITRLRDRHPGDIWKRAEELLDRERPGDFNQAMMELGAMVCAPQAPSCGVCPVARHCKGRGKVSVARKKPQPIVAMQEHYALQERPVSVLLTQRAEDSSQMPGMWELPRLAVRKRTNPVLRLRHSITTRNFDVSIFRASTLFTDRAPGRETTARWVHRERLPAMALTGLTRKVLRKTGWLD